MPRASFDLASEGRQSVSLEELAEPYTNHLVEHARREPRQATNASNALISVCVDYTKG